MKPESSFMPDEHFFHCLQTRRVSPNFWCSNPHHLCFKSKFNLMLKPILSMGNLVDTRFWRFIKEFSIDLIFFPHILFESNFFRASISYLSMVKLVHVSSVTWLTFSALKKKWPHGDAERVGGAESEAPCRWVLLGTLGVVWLLGWGLY